MPPTEILIGATGEATDFDGPAPEVEAVTAGVLGLDATCVLGERVIQNVAAAMIVATKIRGTMAFFMSLNVPPK
jgi:hypothetical protein